LGGTQTTRDENTSKQREKKKRKRKRKRKKKKRTTSRNGSRETPKARPRCNSCYENDGLTESENLISSYRGTVLRGK
jgi:hypothetical protein